MRVLLPLMLAATAGIAIASSAVQQPQRSRSMRKQLGTNGSLGRPRSNAPDYSGRSCFHDPAGGLERQHLLSAEPREQSGRRQLAFGLALMAGDSTPAGATIPPHGGAVVASSRDGLYVVVR